jgi:tetratricopeptide (TPR) repeat protein
MHGMRHTKVLWSTLLGLMIGVVAAGATSNVQAIREVTPTPPPGATAEATDEAPATPVGTLDEQLNAAFSLFENGDYQETIDAASAIIESNPDAAEAYLLRGVAYTQLNNFNRAIDDFTRSIRILPYDWTSYTFRADAYAQSGKIAEALNDYDKAIALNPRYAAAFTGRAALLGQRGDNQNAKIDQLIAEGITSFTRQDLPSALSKFTQAIEVDETPESNVANAYYNRALVYATSGDVDSSIEDYTAAIDLDPEMHDAYLGRGIAYRQIEETEKAGADFAERIDLLGTATTEDTLEIGASQEVTMAYGQVFRFTFEGEEGQRVTLAARDSSEVGVDPLIVLLDPDGTPIAGDDDNGGQYDSEISGFELPADGTYTLIVSHANGGYDGPVSVSVREE